MNFLNFIFHPAKQLHHSFSELAFGEPKRDSRPALQKHTPMMCCVSGSEQPSGTCVRGFHFIFLVCSHDNVKSQTSIRPIPIGVRRVSRRFDIFRSATRLVSLSNILDCGASPRRFSIAPRLVSPLYISDCVESPCRFRFHYALVPLWESGTAERSEASTALAQATHLA